MQNIVPEIDAFILVGGRSSRLGTDKAFVELRGMTLMQRAVANVRDGLPGAKLKVVAGSSAQFAIEALTADVPFIFDLHEGRGPLGGLHAALASAKTPWIFVLACDYPFVSPDLIKILLEAVAEDRGAVVPEQRDGRLQPLCGFYKVGQSRPVVEEILDRPRVPPPMHEVVNRLDPRTIKFDEYAHLPGAEDLFCNINTREDLQQAIDISDRFSPPKQN
ncbi:MAG: molybdenum cofactor guanylyltransferase [Pyrinomonadaceae bacterium]